MIISGRINVSPGGLAHFRKLGMHLEIGSAKRAMQRQFTKEERKKLTFKVSKSEKGHWRTYLDGKETNFVMLEVRI